MASNSSGDHSAVIKKTVRDFEGIKDSEAATIKSTIDFSFYMSVGKMEEAFKCVHAIKSKSVWEHMARICVKTKRIDVAMICLSNIGNSHAVRAIKEARAEPKDVQVALLAAHLGMLKEAETILKTCKRYDVLNRIYQAGGDWENAIKISEGSDRINLKNTYHNLGKYLEEVGDVTGSLAAFEKSSAQAFEIPRMLLSNKGELEKYVNASNDKV